MDINKGEPQGSVLGQLLFVLYINDLPVNIHDANSVTFSDDINVLISVTKDCSKPKLIG